MAAYANADIDIETKTWAQLLATSISDGTIADVLAETKIDDPDLGTVTAANVKDKVGAIYGNVVGVVLSEVWEKARASSSNEVTGTASFSSTGAEYGNFADLGVIAEGTCVFVTGEVYMAADNGSTLYSGLVQFRITARRRAGGNLSVTSAGSLTNGTGTPGITFDSSAVSGSNQLILQSRLSGLGTVTVYQSWRYTATEIEMP